MSDLRTILTGVYEARGSLTPAILVDEARATDHPLHDRFEWDDAIAGEKYRLVQARHIIRSVRIEYGSDDDGTPRTARGYLNVTRDYGDEEVDPDRSYVPTEEALSDPLMSRLVLRQFELDAKAFRARWSHLREYAQVVRAQLLEEAS